MLGAIWSWSKPLSLPSAGYEWAAAIWYQDFAKPGMPPPPLADVWRVVKAPTNALVPGTRAIYDYTPATATTTANFRTTTERVPENTICDWVADHWSNSTSTYARVPASVAVLRPMALCAKVAQ